jgi:hypothetical protein
MLLVALNEGNAVAMVPMLQTMESSSNNREVSKRVRELVGTRIFESWILRNFVLHFYMKQLFESLQPEFYERFRIPSDLLSRF